MAVFLGEFDIGAGLTKVVDNLVAKAPAAINAAVDRKIQKLTAPKQTVAPVATKAREKQVQPQQATVFGIPLPYALGGAALAVGAGIALKKKSESSGRAAG